MLGRLFLLFLLLNSGNISAQLFVDTTLTSQFLVNNILLGPGIVASNIQYTGQNKAYGYFAGSSNIGLNSGVLLTTGRATDAIGPNNNPAKSYVNHAPGDPMLDVLFNQTTMEASCLEFDFVPSSAQVSFRYVFASEEYSEGVCTPYNDLFGFYISGPGIVGIQNLALIPNTNIPVSISSVNGGILGDSIYGPNAGFPYCHLGNTAYYVDNTAGTTVQYDGWTIVLEARSTVIPCETYHIRMVVAEANDPTFDTGVFIEAGSFNSEYVNVSAIPEIEGATINSAAVEGCSDAIIHFERFDDLSFPRTLGYTLSGTADASDYSVNSSMINFGVGEKYFDLIVSPVHDSWTETNETLTVELLPDFTFCSVFPPLESTVKFIDPPEISVSVSNDTSVACGSTEAFLSAQGAGGIGEYTYEWNWNAGSSSSQSFSTTVGEYTVFHVSATDSCKGRFANGDVNVYCAIFYPNTITPNGDGINDQLVISNGIGCSINIFDRWGQVIYSDDYYLNNWSAEGVHDGVYTMQIRLGQQEEVNSILSIIR